MQEKVKGIVLKTMDFKEKDKLMWIFTEELGKVSVLCKGVRNQKSRMQSLAMPLLLGEFMLYKGKSMHTLNEGSVITTFKGLKEDLVLLTYGSYFLELCDIVSMDSEPDRELYRDLITALYILESKALEPEYVARAFELKVIRSSGVSADDGMSQIRISQGARKACEFLQRTDLQKIHILNVSKGIVDEIGELTSFIISASFQRQPKSLMMLKYL